MWSAPLREGVLLKVKVQRPIKTTEKVDILFESAEQVGDITNFWMFLNKFEKSFRFWKKLWKICSVMDILLSSCYIYEELP